MSRHAILLANATKTASKSTNVTKTQAKKNINQISSKLESLGDYAFSTLKTVGELRDDAWNQIRSYINTNREELNNNDSCLLIYYYGHSVIRNRNLYFVFEKSDTSITATMIGFHEVADLAFGFNVRNVIFVLDTCYAGAAGDYQLGINGNHNYAIIASTTSTARAEIYENESPFGAFSLAFFDGLTDMNAAAENEVTVQSLFDYSQKLLRDDGKTQEGELTGGLQNLVLSEASIDVNIDPKYNENAPRKSFYGKMWWIGIYILGSPNISSDNLYSIIERDQPVEFMTPIKDGERTIYRPVRLVTFQGYLHNMTNLGILNDDNGYTLSEDGSRMFGLDGDGNNFNEVLIELVETQLNESNSSLADIYVALKRILNRREIPTATKIYWDLTRSKALKMRSEWFRIILDLATYAGYYRGTTTKTYYP